MLIEFDKDIGQEIREREIFFFNNDIECSCKMSISTCENCLNYYSNPQWRKENEK
jgi:hypothetical protein